MTIRGKTSIVLFTAIALAGLDGCARQDPRLKNLARGISRDSAVAVMGLEKPHRLDPFLVNGQYIEVLYYARPGTSPTDSIPDRKLAPVVVINGTLAGWGWEDWDSIATANRIVVTR